MSTLHSTAVTDSSIHGYKKPWSGFYLLGRAAARVPEVDGFPLDTRMRLVAEIEDAHWQSQFAQEPYYIAGRSYDAYRPAYAMGWTWAEQHGHESFAKHERAMQLAWEADSGGSLLHWREVRHAVKAAWMRVVQQEMQLVQTLPTAEVSLALQPLYRGCMTLSDDLQRMRHVPQNEFARQVMARHILMLNDFADALQAHMQVQHVSDASWQDWSQRLHSHWVQFKASLSSWEAAQVFEVCELRERTLISAFSRALRKPLPGEVHNLLQHQVKQLQINMDKLSWVRHNWSL